MSNATTNHEADQINEVHLPRFRYIARSADGEIRHGEMDGESPYAIRLSLRRIGYQTQSIQRVETLSSTRAFAFLTKLWDDQLRKMRSDSKTDMCDAIATMLQAGITLDDALHSLASSPARKNHEQQFAHRLRDNMRSGMSLSQACLREPKWFNHFETALIAAGEVSGDLHDTLRGLVQHHTRAASIGQKIFIALIYPGLLSIAGLFVLMFMSHQVLPQLTLMIQQAHHTPPSITLFVMHIGQWLSLWWPIVILLVIALIGIVRFSLSFTSPDSWYGYFFYANPLARLARRYRVAQLSWTLSRLCRSGFPLLEAIKIAAQTAEERVLKQSLTAAGEAVARGEDFSQAIAQDRLLDPEFSQLLSLGERSGELVTVLDQIAERSQRSAERATERLVAFINPLAILALSALIGILVLACALPLAQLGDLV